MGETGLAGEDNDAGMVAADPRQKPVRRKRQRSRKVRYARRMLFTLLGFVVFGIIAFAVAYILTPIPSAKSASTASGPTFYYAGGKKEIARIGTNRQLVSIKQVPPVVRQAVVAAENRTFYTDPGVSLSGTARAVWSTVSGAQVQGGSTITQQMVRNYYSGLSQQRSVTRKLKEIMVSLKVGEEKSKDWILEQYLNTIYFGRSAWGIQAASQAYFGQNVQDLNASQAAFLAAAIQQPSVFADADTSAQAKATAEYRWRYVLSGMVQAKTITQQQADAAVFPQLVKDKGPQALGGQTGYMVNQAIQELKADGYSANQIDTGGLKIETTFQPALMSAAKQAVQNNIPSDTSSKVLAGLVAVNPKNGEVLAFYGGRDYLQDNLSTAFGGHTAQAGSGFKPYVLAAALDDGYGLETTEDGSSPQVFKGSPKPIENDNGENYGQVNLITATEKSINTAYVNLAEQVGFDKVTQMAEKMGLTARQLDPVNKYPSFALGTADVSVVQQAGAYATFANGGVYVKPHVIKSITTPDGRKTEINSSGTRVFSQQVANDATYAMTKVVESGTGTAAALDDGRPVAGKTGTTTNGAALWFNGYIPQMATSIGVYREDKKTVQVGNFSAYGGALSATIWHDFMEVATQDMPQQDFGQPSIDIGSGGDQSGSSNTTPPNTPPPSSPPRSRPSSPPHTHRPSGPPVGPPSGVPTGPPPSEPPSGGGGANPNIDGPFGNGGL
jgi:membrane peptidoglycan carboxypeptidase